MRIDNPNLNGAAGLQPGRTNETPAVDALTSTSGTQGSGPAGGDRADISSLAGSISQTLATQTVGRAQRIQELAQQYSAGTYKPDARSISSALVQDAIGGKDGA
jgi:anti-sigma28 factor (negative regulator of flagellin synthesis)